MRSERTECLTHPWASDFYFGPQLEGVIGSGDTIIGAGFGMTVSSNCTCHIITEPELISSKTLQSNDLISLNQSLKSTDTLFLFLSRNTTFTNLNRSNPNATENSNVGINMTFVLGNAKVCGGYDPLNMPICNVHIDHARNMKVHSTYTTDGTPASIALVKAEGSYVLDESNQDINYDSLHHAFTSIFSPGTSYPLVGIVPGMIGPLMYWTSSNLMSINPAILDAGIETAVSMIFRGGIARTFDSEGSFCPRMPVERTDQSIVKLTNWGMYAVYLTGIIQLLFTLFSLVVAMSWVIETTPLGPAMRILKDPTYFMALLAESPFAILLTGASNAQRFVIWQALDTVVRIGETLEPLDEHVGKIKMDR
jgi:hypothetical protein